MSRLRRLARAIEMRSGAMRLYLRRIRGTVVVTYHGIEPAENIKDPWVQTVHIAPDALRRQLEFLLQHFDVVERIDEDVIHRAASNRPAALVTFDDGYRNFLERAMPVLESLGVPATLFVTANCIETGERHPTYVVKSLIAHLEPGTYSLDSIGERIEVTAETGSAVGLQMADRVKQTAWPQVKSLIGELRSHFTEAALAEIDEKYSSDAPMSWDEVRMVRDRGVTIGSHTLDHAVLGSKQSPQLIRAQIAESRDLIERRVGECKLFAYPNGGARDISPEAARAVEDAGYEQAFSMVPGVIRPATLESGRMALPRLGVSGDWNGFRKYVSTCWKHESAYLRFLNGLSVN